MYEQYKFDFEENLQQKTEILNKKLEDLTPRLVILNYMEEFDNVASYIQVSNNIMPLYLKHTHILATILCVSGNSEVFAPP